MPEGPEDCLFEESTSGTGTNRESESVTTHHYELGLEPTKSHSEMGSLQA